MRAALGLKLDGVRMDEKWGVIDSIPLTDFRKSERVLFDYVAITYQRNTKPTFASGAL